MSAIKFKNEKELKNSGLVIDPETDQAVPELAGMTKAVNKRYARLKKMQGEVQAEIIGIGNDLIAIRDHIQQRKMAGGFDDWLSREFAMSRSQAYRLMDLAKAFSDCPNLGHYDLSAMYVLAAPASPQDARNEAGQIAASGDFVDHATATKLIDKYRLVGNESADEESPDGDDGDDDNSNEIIGEAETDENDDDGDENEEIKPKMEHKRRQQSLPSRQAKPRIQDVRRNFRAPNLESKVDSDTVTDHFKIELRKLVTGGGYVPHRIVISDLSRRQLENLRKQIDDALSHTSTSAVECAVSPESSNNSIYFPIEEN